MSHDKNIGEMPLDEVMETLSEEQAKFILHASIIAGHLPRYWFDQGVVLSRSIRT